MNKFDKEIRKMAQQSKCPVSKEYEESIERLLKTLKSDEVRSRKTKVAPLFKFGMAACAVCTIMLASVPVAAKISDYVKERMSNMSEAEQEEYRETNNQEKLTSEHETEAIRYSREMSEEERARFQELSEKYETEGLFPEEEMQMIDQLEDNAEISAIVYEVYNREFFLPERDLTDEELLQIVDFFHKLDYSISQDEEVQAILAEQNKSNENSDSKENNMSEQEAIEKASAYLTEVIDGDAAAMDKTVEFRTGFEYEGYDDYRVTFMDNENNSYSVEFNAKTGTLYRIDLSESSEIATELIEVNEELISSNYDKAKNIFTSALGTDTQFVNSNCIYAINEDNDMQLAMYGSLIYIFELEDGTAYYVMYDLEHNVFINIYYVPAYADEKKMQEDGMIKQDGNKLTTLIEGQHMAVISME